ncbi:Mu-like prophage tail sheath protein gpL [Nostoc sp. PCC 7524]|uniref:phage tail sheath protein n=1 Tax=Nostoc sp. (strain ATCC 29411 / PCC 7524) TaxID=28072 RepID=UPI00029EE010|nr:phage tail sheath protein [Nostoc sp. PCC 7524]AFY49004.1 Mu-like prophage tail sheath protein gpL [Nostoc sp. PCC 7524]
MSSTIFSSFRSPGVRINETTQGYRSLDIASHQAVYMIGSGTNGDAFIPTQVTSLTDFTNVFGSSPSENSVKLFFRNDRRGILYFVRTSPALRVRVTVSSATNGEYPLSIASTRGAVNVSFTASSSTTAQIASGLIEAINNSTLSAHVKAGAGSSSNQLIISMSNPTDPFLAVTSTNSNLAIVNHNDTTKDRREVISKDSGGRVLTKVTLEGEYHKYEPKPASRIRARKLEPVVKGRTGRDNY